MRPVHLVVPAGIGDPARPSGGNEYDRRIIAGLGRAGWTAEVHQVAGSWPQPDDRARRELAEGLARLPDGAVTLVDGLIAAAGRSALVAAARRLRLVVLVHMLFGDGPDPVVTREDEQAVLHSAAAIVTTSQWARNRLIELYALAPEVVHVAAPGVEPAAPAAQTEPGGRLLCVGALAPHKGQRGLMSALAAVADRAWTCTLVGPGERAFTDTLRRQAAGAGIADRIQFRGPQRGADLDRAYEGADVLVHPSLGETYGLVVTEALARGVPVIASDVGGIPEAVGQTEHGRPGLLVRPGDPDALARALRDWLTDPGLRQRLRCAAAERRTGLDGWELTVERIAQVLAATAMR